MRRGRKTKREEINDINKAHRFAAWLGTGNPNAAASLERPLPAEQKPRTPSGKPLEADILRDILSALKKHPLVSRVERKQSGVFQDGNRYIRVGRRGEPDIGGILKGGRAFAIEVKVSGRYPDDNQWRQIYAIRAAGGIAGCAHSVQEAFAIVEGKAPDDR